MVVLCLTPFGASGPYKDYRSEPLTTFHAAGEGYLTPVVSFLMPDVIDRPPVRQGRFAAEYKLATYAAGLVLAAVYHARRSGQGQTIDLSKQDALLGLNFLEFVPYLTTGEIPTRASLAVPFGGIMPCADGYLQLTFHEEHQWRALMELLGNPDWSRQEWAAAAESRLAHTAEINERLIVWLQSRTRDEVVTSGQEIGATVAPYRTLDDVAESEQMKARGFFQPVGHAVVGQRLYPTGPWRFGGQVIRPEPAPLLGQDGDAAFSPSGALAAPASGPPAGSGPLAGVRVVDLTWAVAGPTATMILASLGAEVIKVETSLRLDVLRHVEPTGATTNREKQAVTLNLRHPKAVDLLKRLVAVSDVVADSFRPGVMDGLGLGYEQLRAVKPNLVMFSSSMAGQHGPQSRFAGYAPMFVALSGLGEMTGYADGPPTQIRVGGDIIVGIHGGFALLAALLHLQTTGEGTYIDMSAIESESCLIGDSLLDYTMNGAVQSRSGNDEPGVAPAQLLPVPGRRPVGQHRGDHERAVGGFRGSAGSPRLGRRRAVLGRGEPFRQPRRVGSPGERLEPSSAVPRGHAIAAGSRGGGHAVVQRARAVLRSPRHRPRDGGEGSRSERRVACSYDWAGPCRPLR